MAGVELCHTLSVWGSTLFLAPMNWFVSPINRKWDNFPGASKWQLPNLWRWGTVGRPDQEEERLLFSGSAAAFISGRGRGCWGNILTLKLFAQKQIANYVIRTLGICQLKCDEKYKVNQWHCVLQTSWLYFNWPGPDWDHCQWHWQQEWNHQCLWEQDLPPLPVVQITTIY